jgi:hypothetical protein
MTASEFKELEEYFEALFEMYPTAGWKKLTEDMVRLKEIYSRVDDLETANELWFRKGQLDIINQIIMHQARSEVGYVSAIEQRGGTADEPTGGNAKVVS